MLIFRSATSGRSDLTGWLTTRTVAGKHGVTSCMIYSSRSTWSWRSLRTVRSCQPGAVCTSLPGTGWAQVEAEISELRRHFAMARTDQDYRTIGNDCVAVVERLSATVFDPDRHVKGEDPPPLANTKQRLGLFVRHTAPGPPNAEIRKVARAVIELAQAVKHRKTPSRRDAGIAADSVIQLANVLRRLADE